MKPLGYGLLGAGAFGRFCLDAFGALPEVERVAVADERPEAAEGLGLPVLSPDELIARPDVDLIHVATPPFTHRDVVARCLEAGKHVLCEKPLATTLEDGEALVALARERNLLLAVNLIMRYDPLLEAVAGIVRDRLLGAPLRATFENLAQDSQLGPDHWFWDRARSGGIFVEHGVHFFDLFESFFGEGRIVAARAFRRPESGVEEAVEAWGDYPGGVAAGWSHSFTQAKAMDRQEMRLVFERGDLRLHEWVPTRVEIELLGTRAEADEVAARLPRVAGRQSSSVEGGPEHRARFRTFEAEGRHRITGDVGMKKPDLYRHVVRELLRDGIAWIRDPSHVRRVDEGNALRSLAMASEARRLAAEADQ